MIQLACGILMLIATNQTFGMMLQKDKIKDWEVLVSISGILEALGWGAVLNWSF